jgi:threonine/homoserine/homoserine lactone efflux protein
MLSMEFILTSLVVVLVPGTGVIYTVSTGLFLGRKAAFAAASGCTAGILPHLAASILGLSTILHLSALAFQAMKYAGALYLLYLAWSMWRTTGTFHFDSPSSGRGLRQVAKRGFLINILNPKLSIFFLAFLPLFVAPVSATPMVQLLTLSSVFMAMTLVIFILYGTFASLVRQHVVRSPAGISRLQRSFAVIFAVLGVRLALTER